jgi:hypothetical protein
MQSEVITRKEQNCKNPSRLYATITMLLYECVISILTAGRVIIFFCLPASLALLRLIAMRSLEKLGGIHHQS